MTGLLPGSFARAQTVPPPPPPRPPLAGQSPQELNPAAMAPPAQAPEHRNMLSPPPPGPCPLRNSTTPLTLRGVTFKDADEIASADLAAAYAPYVGRTVTVAAICDIRDRAQDIFFEHGILARVTIPAQSIRQGHLELDVIEAYVAGVRVHGDNAATDKVREYIEKLRGMRPFNINLAQRYLFLAHDVPGVQIAATLIPSSQEGARPGALVLDVTVLWKPYDVGVVADNFGGHSTGPWSGLVRLDLNSLTSLGERTTLVGYSSIDFREQRVLQWIEDVPIGDDGLLASFSLAYGKTRPGGQVVKLDFSGTSVVGELQLSYPLIRSRHENLELFGGFDYIDQNIDVGGFFPLTRDHLRVLYAKLDEAAQLDFELPVQFHAGLEVRKGVDILGAKHFGGPAITPIGGHPDAWLVRADGDASVQWLPLFSTVAKLNVQYTNERLLSYEQLAFGNLTIGRGYDPSAFTGDRGILGSLEAHVGDFPIMDIGSVTAMGFYDVGVVRNLDPNAENRTLKSVGGGLITQWADGFGADVTYAHPLTKIFGQLSKEPPHDTVLFYLTYQY